MERVTTLPAAGRPPDAPAPDRAESPGSVWRTGVLRRLERVEEGIVAVQEAGGGDLVLGRPAPDGLGARMSVHDPVFWRRVALGGTVGAAESYADGDWTADDLTSVVRVLVRNRAALDGVEGGLARVRRGLLAVAHALRRNTRGGSRRNIADHYDLGNAFFELMLDPTMTYSCGIFERPDATLEEASVAKMEALCRRLGVSRGDHLLEIGTGWGGLAIHAATRHGCRVTTATISRRQHELATERVRRAGVADRVTVLLSDYRDLRGKYDKLVSVEMIEAVGAEYYETFFAKCASLLRADGIMALQAITISDRHYERARREVDFVKRFIFPGSCIPSTTALLAAATRASDLRLRHLDDIGPHYATTLAAWRSNLRARRPAVERLTDARFRRLWDFYLCYCEAGFRERYLGDVQMLLARPGAR
ncbi:MAG TPA: cyclopropane-fatty-acyl-phospholipid synthase family protein [Anaeromyxobacter sp.]